MCELKIMEYRCVHDVFMTWYVLIFLKAPEGQPGSSAELHQLQSSYKKLSAEFESLQKEHTETVQALAQQKEQQDAIQKEVWRF